MKSSFTGQFLRLWFVCLPLDVGWFAAGEDDILQRRVGLCTLPFAWLGFSSVPPFGVSFCCTNLQEHTADIRKSCWIGLEEQEGMGDQDPALPLCIYYFFIIYFYLIFLCFIFFISLGHPAGATGALSAESTLAAGSGMGTSCPGVIVPTAGCRAERWPREMSTRLGQVGSGTARGAIPAAGRALACRSPSPGHWDAALPAPPQKTPVRSAAFLPLSPPPPAGPGGSKSSA